MKKISNNQLNEQMIYLFMLKKGGVFGSFIFKINCNIAIR